MTDPLLPHDRLEANWYNADYGGDYTDITQYRIQVHFRVGPAMTTGQLRPGLVPSAGTMTLKDPRTNLFNLASSPLREQLMKPVRVRSIMERPLPGLFPAVWTGYASVVPAPAWTTGRLPDMAASTGLFREPEFTAAIDPVTGVQHISFHWSQPTAETQNDTTPLRFTVTLGSSARIEFTGGSPTSASVEGGNTLYGVTFGRPFPPPLEADGAPAAFVAEVSEPTAEAVERVRWEAIAQPPRGDYDPTKSSMKWTLRGLEWDGLNRLVADPDLSLPNPQRPTRRIARGTTIRQAMMIMLNVAGLDAQPRWEAEEDPGYELGDIEVEGKVIDVMDDLAKLAGEVIYADSRGRIGGFSLLTPRAPDLDVTHLRMPRVLPVEPDFDRSIAFVGQWAVSEETGDFFEYPGDVHDLSAPAYRGSSTGFSVVG